MFLKEPTTGHLVEVLDLQALFDPFQTQLSGRYHVGEELPEPANFNKADLVFLSGEHLPECWLDPDYREPHPATSAILTRSARTRTPSGA